MIKTRRTLRLLVFPLGTALLISSVLACGGDDEKSNVTVPPSGEARILPEIDPCTLITEEEAEAAAGLPLEMMTGTPFKHPGNARAEPRDFLKPCSYATADGAKGVAIGVAVFDSVSAARAHLLSQGSSSLERVPGVGDEALWQWNISSVLTRRGPVYIQVVGKLGLTEDAQRNAVTALAAIAVTRVDATGLADVPAD